MTSVYLLLRLLARRLALSVRTRYWTYEYSVKVPSGLCSSVSLSCMSGSLKYESPSSIVSRESALYKVGCCIRSIHFDSPRTRVYEYCTRLQRSGMWLREHVEPLLVLLSAICRVSNTIRRYCRLQVLPPMRTEVLTLPQSGTSLRNRHALVTRILYNALWPCNELLYSGILCRICAMLTGPIMEVSSAAADFLFVLCNENGMH